MAKTKTRKNPHGERFTKAAELVDRDREYTVDEAIDLIKKTSTTKKLQETVDLAVRLGIDPKKGDQNVRGTTNLPHGTGKNLTVAVLAKGDQLKEAEEAGADVAGEEDLIKKIQEGWKDFDIMVAATEMAPQIGKIGRFLGPKTPNKKNGTVTDNITDTVKEIKSASRIEYRIDKAGIVHLPIGKTSLSEAQIKENLLAAMDALIKAKPSGSKGRYLRSVTISSTMGPGIKLDPTATEKAID